MSSVTYFVRETCASQAAVDVHETDPEFLAYREQIHPLIDGGSVVFGDTPGDSGSRPRDEGDMTYERDA